MALSGGIGQAISNQEDTSWVTVVSYSGKGLLSSIVVEAISRYPNASMGSTYKGTGYVRVVIDGVSATIGVINITVGPGWETTYTTSALGLQSIKMPFNSSLQVQVQSSSINSEYVRLRCTTFYVKEV